MRILFVITLLIAFSISKPTLAMRDGVPDLVPYQTATPEAELDEKEELCDLRASNKERNAALKNYCDLWGTSFEAGALAECNAARDAYIACYDEHNSGGTHGGIPVCNKATCTSHGW